MTSEVPPENRPARNWRTIALKALACLFISVPLFGVTGVLLTGWGMSRADDPGPVIPLFLLGTWLLLLVLACRWIFKRPPR